MAKNARKESASSKISNDFDGLFNLGYQKLRKVPHRRVIPNEGPN